MFVDQLINIAKMDNRTQLSSNLSHSSSPNKTVLLLHKLLLKLLPVTTFYVRNSVVLFCILCLYAVHIGAFVVVIFTYTYLYL